MLSKARAFKGLVFFLSFLMLLPPYLHADDPPAIELELSASDPIPSPLPFKEFPYNNPSAVTALVKDLADKGRKELRIFVQRGLEKETTLLVDTARAAGINLEIIAETDEAVQQRESLYRKFKSLLDRHYDAPAEGDKKMARIIVAGTFVGAIIGWNFLFPDHHFLRAAGFVGANVFAAWLMTNWFGFFNNLFGNRTRGQLHAERSPWAETLVRLGISTFWAGTFRWISGPMGDSHSIFSLPGVLEVVSIGLAQGIPAARYATWINRFNDPQEARNANLLWFAMTYPFFLMEQTGTYLVNILDVSWPVESQYFKLTGTLSLLLVMSAALIYWVRNSPDTFRSFVRSPGDHFRAGFGKVMKKTRCALSLTGLVRYRSSD